MRLLLRRINGHVWDVAELAACLVLLGIFLLRIAHGG